MRTNLFKSLLVAVMAIGAMGGVNSAFAQNNEEVIVNENFDNGAKLFKDQSRISLKNDDNNVKFITPNNSTNAYSNATYDFDTKDAVAVKVQFSYWIANANCNSDVAFIIRDKELTAKHGKQKMGLDGAFISIGRCRDKYNYFSVNRNKTLVASADNLGLWCNAEVYIDLIKKTVDYKVSKLDGGDIIKEEKGIPFKDKDVVNVNQIDFYACVNKETDYLDNLVITKYTSELPSYNYTINAVCGEKTIKQLGNGNSLQYLSYRISNLPFAIMDEGICYKVNDSDVKDYKKTFTMGETDATETVSYTVADDISYFFEAEDILSRSFGNTDGPYSGGTTAGVVGGANLTMPSIAAGKYTVTVNSSVRKSNEDKLKVQVSTDNKEWTDAGIITLTSNVGGNYFLENVNLPKDGYIRLVENTKYNMCHNIDYVTLYRTGDATETVSVSEAGFATYATKYNVEVPEDENVKVMTVKVNAAGTAIELNKVEAGKVIPAETGILVKAAKGNYNFVVTSKEGKPLENNNLVAATTDVHSDGAKYYALTKIGDKVGFALVANGVVIPAGKAYLEVTKKGEAAKFFGLDGEATGINSVKTAKADGAYYTLEGVKTTKPVKGIYIHNGKKIVVK